MFSVKFLADVLTLFLKCVSVCVCVCTDERINM